MADVSVQCKTVNRFRRLTTRIDGKSVGNLRPGRGVIARLLPAANFTIDAGTDEPRRKRGTEQQVIDAQPAIAPEVISKEIPEGVDAILGMHPAKRVGPAARE
jgi:hypothetical protein